MHGAHAGPPKGNVNARKHGGYSAETKFAARYLRALATLIRGEGIDR